MSYSDRFGGGGGRGAAGGGGGVGGGAGGGGGAGTGWGGGTGCGPWARRAASLSVALSTRLPFRFRAWRRCSTSFLLRSDSASSALPRRTSSLFRPYSLSRWPRPPPVVVLWRARALAVVCALVSRHTAGKGSSLGEILRKLIRRRTGSRAGDRERLRAGRSRLAPLGEGGRQEQATKITQSQQLHPAPEPESRELEAASS
jgi:hypothetical protein